jgi:phytoene dehydrogenase-like protein
MTARDADVIVVGAGVCGLTSAVALARAGHRVLVCESGPVAGGRARTTGQDGYLLNFGPRALYDGPLARLLRSLRLPVSGGTATTGRAHALYRGDLLPGYASARSLLRSRMLSVRDRAELAVLLGTGRPRSGLAGLSAADWLAGRLTTERARLAAFALLRVSTYAGRADHISADSAATQLHLVRRGVRYVHGGWQSIVDALRADALAHGATLRTSAKVTAVQSGAVTLAGGEVLTAGAVVVAGLSPRQAARVLDLPALAEPAGPELHTACFDVALSRLPQPGNTLVYGVDEPVYLAVHSGSARIAPTGGAVLHLARYDDGRPVTATAVRAGLEALLDRCQAGWRSVVVHQRFLPRMTTMWSLPTAVTGGLVARPDVRLPDRPGVFLAGDWVGPSGLLADAAAGSALLAARAARTVLVGNG